uniref:Uncharacterized protein n=1 Tax=Arundo donax TaxID=35708 RepID=A0A0A9AX20_ARUDO
MGTMVIGTYYRAITTQKDDSACCFTVT